jgi:cytochrome P450
LIANGLLALLRNRDQFNLLRNHPELIKSGVEELLRYDSPGQFMLRIAKETVELEGETIEAGQQVIVMLGSANHDPKIFAHPEKLDVTRQENPHVSLGAGIHYCLGAPLARMEASIAFEVLLKRFPKMRLITQEPTFYPSLLIRQMECLEIAF